MESLAGRVVLLSGWRRSLVSFAAGGFASLSQPPFDFFAACFVAFPVLVWLLDGAVGEGRGLRSLVIPAFKTGWWFGFGYFMLGLWWIGTALLVDAENYAWAVPFAVVGIPAFLAIFYGLAALLSRFFWSDGIMRVISLAFFFGIIESIRGIVFTGFPWGAIGYAAMPTLLSMQSAKVLGLAGMNFLAVLVFSMPALLGTRRHLLIGSITAIGLVTMQLAYGYLSLSREIRSDNFLPVRIVQPSIKQTEKWDSSEQTRIFNILLDLTRRQTAEGVEKPKLIVWPETAVPFLFTERPEALVQLGEALDEGQMLLTGAVRAEGGDGLGPTRYYNSVVAIGQDGTIIDAVDKVHLVPFGEYVPFANLLNNLGIEEIVQSAGPFTAGGVRRPLTVFEGTRIMPFVCYEIIFPHLVAEVADQSDILVNVTNDAWFGVTPGPYQHFRQARVRAVENGRPLLRAANSGISAVIDSSGRIIDAFDLNAVGNLDLRMPIEKPEKFYFENPGTNGMFIAFGFGTVLFGSSIVRRLRAN
ncbi:apolipoprotein N-acyltransferase [Nitratireductor kimnyeongensis]|uniref:Apolipoprotein N-acyltransferase n=1 Tax=Nitratireductor kimnyeongensis TaxID=430679 RepID=A0ABW0T872_9HYPH|nr:apolipoprotein N-acyltransferase [Nitratireductor kimnyeongensis]QZZ34089.1 apolipoprotein N-acyltransferase [Nitratireductor kimnyeongensis]